MGQRHKHADVIIAWAEGKDVQVWDEGAKRWCDVNEALSFMADKYRVKPPPKKYRVALFKDTYSGNIYTSTTNAPEDANFYEKDQGFIRWLTDWIEYEK